jgi:hypothetical protein
MYVVDEIDGQITFSLDGSAGRHADFQAIEAEKTSTDTNPRSARGAESLIENDNLVISQKIEELHSNSRPDCIDSEQRERGITAHRFEHRHRLGARAERAFGPIARNDVPAFPEAVVDAEVAQDIEVGFGLGHDPSPVPQAEATRGTLDHRPVQALDEL